MATERPFNCINSTYSEAVTAGCDLVQAKARGEPCRIRIKSGKVRVTGYDGGSRLDFPIDNTTVDCVLYGAVFARERFARYFVLVIDCFVVAGQDVSSESYRDRFSHAKEQVDLAGHPLLKLVSNYPIDRASDLWDHLDPVYANGLVYRKSSDTVEAPLRVCRKYREQPGGLP